MEPVPREELHCRRIEMRGYRRTDGLFEVEGHLVDTKPFDFTPAATGAIRSAGEPLHDMLITLIFDDKMVVRDARVVVAAAPYPMCPKAGARLSALIGLSMTSGWNAEVRARLARSENCTHLVELLGPMATTALQSLSTERGTRPEPVDADGRPKKIDSCYAYAACRDVVRARWPNYHRPKDDAR